MWERYYRRLGCKLDPDGRVQIVRASQNPGFAEFCTVRAVEVMCHLEPDGTICVLIDDRGEASKGCWLEELGHALQYLRLHHQRALEVFSHDD